ncbi:MAG TPA: hypothetical protein VFP29_03850 [Methyloceanibacter sp.]|nr:hypothetical protein [Methyloceanibacter sp.]
MVELDLEGYAREILGGKPERGLRQVDAVIMLDLGRTKSLLHLAGIAAGNVEKGEGLRDHLQRLMEDPPDFLVGECIAIDQLLVSRPLSLELLESGLVIDRGSRSEMVNVDVHDGVHQSAPKRGSTLGQVYKG